MASERQIKVAESLAHLAAQFISQESNRTSLITVTRADVSPDLKQATIYFTVLPDDMTDGALNFLRRSRPEFRTFVKKHAHIKTIPFFDFDVDYGEKHRQRMDEISREVEDTTGKIELNDTSEE